MRWFIFWFFMLFALTLGIPPEYRWLSGFISGGLLVAAILGWFYKQETKTVKELRERLGECEPNSKYRNLTNKQLKNKTLTHTKGILALIEKYSVDSIQAKSDLDVKYKNKYRADSSVLRDELWKRLPTHCITGESCEAEKLCRAAYNSEAIFPMLLESLVADLEHLANSLSV